MSVQSGIRQRAPSDASEDGRRLSCLSTGAARPIRSWRLSQQSACVRSGVRQRALTVTPENGHCPSCQRTGADVRERGPPVMFEVGASVNQGSAGKVVCDNERRLSCPRKGAVRRFRERASSIMFEYGRRPSCPSTNAARQVRAIWYPTTSVISEVGASVNRLGACYKVSEYGRRPSCPKSVRRV